MAVALKVSRVQKKGQVTIPAEIRNKLGLEEGDLVAFIETAQGVMLRAQALVPVEALDKLEANWRQSQAQGERPEPFGFVERLKQEALPATGTGTPAGSKASPNRPLAPSRLSKSQRIYVPGGADLRKRPRPRCAPRWRMKRKRVCVSSTPTSLSAI